MEFENVPRHIREKLKNQWERLLDFDTARREGLVKGIAQNKKRAAESRSKWREQAKRLKEIKPYLDIDQLASETHKWCITNCVRMGNGRHYSLRTILDDLKKNLPL